MTEDISLAYIAQLALLTASTALLSQVPKGEMFVGLLSAKA